MRRKDKEITDKAILESILHAGKVITLCLMDGQSPYMVPVNYGYQDGTLYFHSAKAGRKVDVLAANPAVQGLIITESEVFLAGAPDAACNLSTRFQSILLQGKAERITDPEEALQGMRVMLKHLNQDHLPLPENQMDTIFLYRITVESMTGKRSPNK